MAAGGIVMTPGEATEPQQETAVLQQDEAILQQVGWQQLAGAAQQPLPRRCLPKRPSRPPQPPQPQDEE